MANDYMEIRDELIQAMQDELERAVTQELNYDTAHVSGDPNQERNVNADHERIKNTLMPVLVASVHTQRLYFVIRSVIMGVISGLITLAAVWFLGTVQVVQVIFLGIFVFIVALVVSRLFDKQIVKTSRKIVAMLDKHKWLRVFILRKL